MADNVSYTPGEGVEIAADEIDGVLHQRAKIQFGEDGAATDVSDAAPLPVKLTQDFEANGALIVAPDTAQQWPVKLQAADTAGVLRDLKVTPRGELLTAAADHQYFKTLYSGSTVSGTVLLGPVMAEGYASASLVFGTNVSPAGFQASMDGLTWVSLPCVSPLSGSGSMSQTTNFYLSANQLVTISLPPCAQLRVVSLGTQTLTNCLVSLTLSKTPKVDAVVARVTDVQVADNTAQANSTSMQALLVAGADATKRTRVLATDGTVNAKSQGSANQAAGNSPAQPFYGHVLTTAIARTAAYAYGADQPAALQSNTRGELQVDQQETRRLLEQQLLAQQAAALQALDPNWGFEIR